MLSRSGRLASRTRGVTSLSLLHSTFQRCPRNQAALFHGTRAARSNDGRPVLVGHNGPFPPRTHKCGDLGLSDVNKEVVLTGWLVPKGKMGKNLSFFDLRDASGTTQLISDTRVCGAETLTAMRNIPEESTVLVKGVVSARPESQRRLRFSGDIEVAVKSFILLNPADRNMPFMPFDNENLANEDLRLRYRYLDLRRHELTENLRTRSDVAYLIRDTLREEGFTEVETPMLLNSTPEGAREYLVPTRVKQTSEGTAQPAFYALSQSPQQPKQLLVVSGAVDRYFQFARCFRDEDGRKDRQPEFTQVDLEMGWVSWGSSSSFDPWRIGGVEVRDVVERIIRKVWNKVAHVKLEDRFRVMTYNEAMRRYGSDKPDLRFGLEIVDITSVLPAPLRAALESRGEIMEAIAIKPQWQHEAFHGAVDEVQDPTGVERISLTRETDSEWLKQVGLVRDLLPTTDVALDPTDVYRTLGLHEGGTVWLSRRPRRPEGGWTPLGRLRLALSEAAQRRKDLNLDGKREFLWVTEFPLFTRADEDKEFLAHGRWSSSHHPFTAPMHEDVEKLLANDVEEVRGQHYDLVLNGVEIGGGSVRIHDAAMQRWVLEKILQLDEKETRSFEHLLTALRYGAPPHGGFAFGFDRLMAVLCHAASIRDVIAFPKTAAGTDLLFKSPSPSTDEVLAQYALRARST